MKGAEKHSFFIHRLSLYYVSYPQAPNSRTPFHYNIFSYVLSIGKINKKIPHPLCIVPTLSDVSGSSLAGVLTQLTLLATAVCRIWNARSRAPHTFSAVIEVRLAPLLFSSAQGLPLGRCGFLSPCCDYSILQGRANVKPFSKKK